MDMYRTVVKTVVMSCGTVALFKSHGRPRVVEDRSSGQEAFCKNQVMEECQGLRSQTRQHVTNTRQDQTSNKDMYQCYPMLRWRTSGSMDTGHLLLHQSQQHFRILFVYVCFLFRFPFSLVDLGPWLPFPCHTAVFYLETPIPHTFNACIYL